MDEINMIYLLKQSVNKGFPSWISSKSIFHFFIRIYLFLNLVVKLEY